MKSAIVGLLLGLTTLDQMDTVDAVQLNNQLRHRSRSRRHHHRGIVEPQWNIQTEYESPFGLDASHGYGGLDQKKMEE